MSRYDLFDFECFLATHLQIKAGEYGVEEATDLEKQAALLLERVDRIIKEMRLELDA